MGEKNYTVSAPGKLMLFGEHAVVYGYPCIVSAVDRRIKVMIKRIKQYELRIKALDMKVNEYVREIGIGEGEQKKETLFVETAMRIWKERYGLESGLSIETHADFSYLYGFGSSSAVTVATIYGLSQLFKKKISQKELFDLSYKTVLAVQKKGSGFDVAASIFGNTIFFQNVGNTIRVQPCTNELIHLIIGYTGVKADTVALVEKVEKRRESREVRERVDGIFREIGEIVEKARNLLQKEIKGKNGIEETKKKLGILMNENQTLLENLGVNSEKLDRLISAARHAGVYGAKLSGAGGGDCMIALAPEEKRDAVEQAIVNAGGEILNVTVHADGVRVEKEMV